MRTPLLAMQLCAYFLEACERGPLSDILLPGMDFLAE